MSDQTDPTDRPALRAGRRGFFLLGMHAALKAVEDFLHTASRIPLPTVRTLIRPPGSIEEKEFLKTCYRCGSCVDACTAHAIRPWQGTDEEQVGTPFIDPDLQACTLCEALPCTTACPSGALRQVSRNRIRIGVTHWTARGCARSAGQDCRICLDRCPIVGAIRIGPRGQIEVISERCTGCGICQQACPARPKAIRVEPL